MMALPHSPDQVTTSSFREQLIAEGVIPDKLDRSMERPAKRARTKYYETVMIEVGAESKIFHVPENLLCTRSPFFEAACSKRWLDEGDGVIRLREDDLGTFNNYLHVLHANEWPPPDTADAGARIKLVEIVLTYIFADKMRDVVSMNILLNTALDVFRTSDGKLRRCTKLALNALYAGTTDTSPMRRLFVDFATEKMESALLYPWLSSKDSPADFIRDVAMKLSTWHGEKHDSRRAKAFRDRRKETYHHTLASTTTPFNPANLSKDRQ